MNRNGLGKRCGFCKGSGKAKKSEMDYAVASCPVCRGNGFVHVPGNYTICIECGGRGRKPSGYAMTGASMCETCEGTGWAKALPEKSGKDKKRKSD